MKTTLCETCMHGMVREEEGWGEGNDGHFTNPSHMVSGCLLDDTDVEVVTRCNRYRKTKRRITYHDPDFAEYEKTVESEKSESLDYTKIQVE